MNAVIEWKGKEEAYNFRTASFAIDFCVMRRLRNVRVIVSTGNPADDVFLDVHGVDSDELSAGIRENRRLRERQRVLKAELDAVQAELKEKRKQFPFKRPSVAQGDPPRMDMDGHG